VRRRPALRSLGAVVFALLVGLTLAGCDDGPLDLDAPAVTGQDAAACRALVRALPRQVADQPRRDVTGTGFGAAWGDPAIELRCGVPTPRRLDPFATCQVVNGVGWFIPESQTQGRRVDIVMTTVGRAQDVEVRLPSEYFPPATAMVDLAPAVKRGIREVEPCL
jgi:hypothetical protein